jgi:hypothetical protein
MCGLCGILGVEAHWTDDPSASPESRRADREHRARIASRVLSLYGLRLRTWGGRFTLEGRTGKTAVVDHLAAVWPAAERLAGRPCDPLDPAVIGRLEAQGAQP